MDVYPTQFLSFIQQEREREKRISYISTSYKVVTILGLYIPTTIVWVCVCLFLFLCVCVFVYWFLSIPAMDYIIDPLWLPSTRFSFLFYLFIRQTTTETFPPSSFSAKTNIQHTGRRLDCFVFVMLRVSTIHGCVPDRRKIYIKGTVALFLSILLEFDNSYLLCPTMPIFAHQKVSQRRRRRTPLSLSVKNCVKRRIGSTVFPSTRHRDERIFLGCVLLMVPITI